MSIFPIRKHRKCCEEVPQRYHPMGRYRSKTLITRYQASREPHDVTSGELSIVVWKRSASSEERFFGVSISGLLSLNRYRSLISINLVSVWEVNFVLYN